MLVTERHSYQQASSPMGHSGEARVPTTRGGSVEEFPGGGAGGSSYSLTSTQLCHHVIVNISGRTTEARQKSKAEVGTKDESL